MNAQLNVPIPSGSGLAAAPFPPQIDFGAIKQRQHATWASGDYAIVGTTLQIVGENLVEAVDLRAGEQVLDVAAGNGNATLAAARRFAHVTSTDYVPELLEKAPGGPAPTGSMSGSRPPMQRTCRLPTARSMSRSPRSV
jgi:hypothetical protein